MALFRTAFKPEKCGSSVVASFSSNLDGPTNSRAISFRRAQEIPATEHSSSSLWSEYFEALINASAISLDSLMIVTQLFAESPRILKLLSMMSAISLTAVSLKHRNTQTSRPGRKHCL